MLNIDFTFLWTAVNLVVLFLFLRKFLFGRVTKFMDARADAIRSDMEKGATDKAEGERYRSEQMTLMKEAAAQRIKILDETRKKADVQYEATLAAAKVEADRIVATAHAEAEREKEKILTEMQSEIASLALAAASRVIAVNMDNDKNRKLVEEMLNELNDGKGVA